MTTSRTVEVKTPGTMTLADLRAFLAEMDDAKAPDSNLISGTVRFGGGLKGLKAKVAASSGNGEQQR